METSIALAQVIGPLLLIIGIGLIVNLEHYRRVIADFGASPLQIYVSGTMAIVFGLLIIGLHNVWVWHWPVIITVLGWLTLLKGTVRVVAPQLVAQRSERYARNKNPATVSALVLLALGAVLSYFAFVPGA